MTSHKPHQPIGSAPPAITAFPSALNGAVTEAMGKSASVFGKSVRAFQQESVKFMARRIEDNMKAVEQFGTCRTFPDFFAAQQKWFTDTARAYNQELVRCGELMTEAFDIDDSAGNGNHDRSSVPRK